MAKLQLVPTPKPVCERRGCEKKGRLLHHERVRVLAVKGNDPQRTVAIHFYRCAIYWPRPWTNLHSEARGPRGEMVEILGVGHYRFTDSVTGEVIETERKRRYKPTYAPIPQLPDSVIRFCEREGCPRKGWKMRHTAVNLNIKDTQEGVIIDVFKCETSRPSKVFHKEVRGRNGETAKLLRLHAGEYELTDPKTGKVIVTQKRTHHGDHISVAGKKRLSRSKSGWWKKNPEKKKEAGDRMRSLRVAELQQLGELAEAKRRLNTAEAELSAAQEHARVAAARADDARMRLRTLQQETENQDEKVARLVDEAIPKFERLFSLAEIRGNPRLLLNGWRHSDFSHDEALAARDASLSRRPKHEWPTIAARCLVSLITHYDVAVVKEYHNRIRRSR